MISFFFFLHRCAAEPGSEGSRHRWGPAVGLGQRSLLRIPTNEAAVGKTLHKELVGCQPESTASTSPAWPLAPKSGLGGTQHRVSPVPAAVWAAFTDPTDGEGGNSQTAFAST